MTNKACIPALYSVIWEIELDQCSPVEAAQEALRIQRDPTSIALCYQVFNKFTKETVEVDLWHDMDNVKTVQELTPDEQYKADTRSFNVGESDYAEHDIQPWDVWLEYQLNPWDADAVKRLLRTKAVPHLTAQEARIADYKKIQHICQERIDQICAGDRYYRPKGDPR